MLYLASQSPRRRQLLEQIGVAFTPVDVDVPEQRAPGESPLDYVSRVALDKARAGRSGLPADAVVLSADTEVVLDDEVFGKPADAADATAMLRRLSGRTHETISVVWALQGERAESATCVSRVRFARLADEDVAAYVASGEPFGRAGAYAIQGLGATLIEYLEGSFTGVMGLPVFETARLLRRFGIR